MENNVSNVQTPEKIVFINGVTGEVRKEVDFRDVPPSISFAKSKDGISTPVVKIVDVESGDNRTIKQYGDNDVLLRTTFQRREK